MIQFIAGMFAGAVITIGIMVIFRCSEEDNKRDDIHHICDDCKYGNLPLDEAPCDWCVGDHYDPK